jgi:glycosyltransferase involved in cell wall biosynthesis
VRIAIVHPYPVHQRAVGGTTRVYALVRHLAARHELHVFAHAHGNPEEEQQAIRELGELGVVQRVIPRPANSWLVKARWVFDRSPYFLHHNRSPMLESALAELDRERGLDVAHVEFDFLEPLLGGLSQNCARVLAEQELMSVSIDRLRKVQRRHKSVYDHYISLELPRVRAFEASTLRRFDRLFGINEGEAARMAAVSGRSVEVLPHVVDTRVFTPGDAPPVRHCVLFVGNYDHKPNVDAAFWLMEQVWPAVRRRVPAATVRLVGPGLDAGRRTALERLGAEVAGRVEDLVGAYREAMVFANPIHSGGGMRGKVLEAFACGVPVVSTTIGLEGVAAHPGEDCERADEAEPFADAIVRLLGDPAACRARAGRALALVSERYDARLVMGRLESAFEEAHAHRRADAGATA